MRGSGPFDQHPIWEWVMWRSPLNMGLAAWAGWWPRAANINEKWVLIP